LIAYYKYAGFFIRTANDVAGLDYAIPHIILPLGISFYTFTQIAYLVDAYREDLRGYDFLTYNLFISFYPQLIAGPLLLHKELMPQLQSRALFRFSADDLIVGLAWFFLGLGKKVLLADTVAPLAAGAFDNPQETTFFGAWFGVLAYTLQLYFDFSGYSDMAIGLSRMFGVQLPMNFNSPYKAVSIIDFWRRWHMTLSRFLRDYLYVALGGNRHGQVRRFVNLMLTMLLGGLWHGAGWNFIIWGGLHGAYLIVNHGWRHAGLPMPKLLGWLITMLAVIVGWVFFRAASASDAVQLLLAMVGLNGFELPTAWLQLMPGTWRERPELRFNDMLPSLSDQLLILALAAVAVGMPNSQTLMMHFQRTSRMAWACGLLATFCLLSMNQVSEFLYFQF
jgi:alginate O-acetyltransferase complex protein AlgI